MSMKLKKAKTKLENLKKKVNKLQNKKWDTDRDLWVEQRRMKKLKSEIKQMEKKK